MNAREHTDSRTPGTSPPRNLQSRTWNALLDLHGALFSRLNGTLVRDFGISLAKYDVLAQLDGARGGMTQGELSRRLKVTGGNVSGLVRRMAAEKLIERAAAPDDRRAVIVRATAQGRETFAAARAHHDALLQDWLGDSNEGMLAQLCAQLTALRDRVDAAERASPK